MFRLALTRLVSTSRISIRSSKFLTNRSRDFLRNVSTESNDPIKQSRIPLGNINDGVASPRMGIQFRCKVCDHTLQKTFTRQSYEQGVVIIRCDSCSNLHLIADNLGWFTDLTQDGKFKYEFLRSIERTHCLFLEISLRCSKLKARQFIELQLSLRMINQH